MPSFDADAKRITAFRVDDEYLFTHYFARTDLFEELGEYYDGEAYRFEVPADEFSPSSCAATRSREENVRP